MISIIITILLCVTLITVVYLLTTKGIHFHKHTHVYPPHYPEAEEEKTEDQPEERVHNIFSAITDTMKDVID